MARLQLDMFSEISVLDLLGRFDSLYAECLLVLRAEGLCLIAKLSSLLCDRSYLYFCLLLSEKGRGIPTAWQLVWLPKSAMPVLRGLVWICDRIYRPNCRLCVRVVSGVIFLRKHTRLTRIFLFSANLRWLVRYCFLRLHKQGLNRVVLYVTVSVNECLSANEARLEVNH